MVGPAWLQGSAFGPASIPDTGPGPGLTLLVGLMLGLLWLAAALVLLQPAMEARRLRRSGWWMYLVGFCVPAVNVLLLVAWYAYLRRHPTLLGSVEV